MNVCAAHADFVQSIDYLSYSAHLRPLLNFWQIWDSYGRLPLKGQKKKLLKIFAKIKNGCVLTTKFQWDQDIFRFLLFLDRIFRRHKASTHKISAKTDRASKISECFALSARLLTYIFTIMPNNLTLAEVTNKYK